MVGIVENLAQMHVQRSWLQPHPPMTQTLHFRSGFGGTKDSMDHARELAGWPALTEGRRCRCKCRQFAKVNPFLNQMHIIISVRASGGPLTRVPRHVGHNTVHKPIECLHSRRIAQASPAHRDSAAWGREGKGREGKERKAMPTWKYSARIGPRKGRLQAFGRLLAYEKQPRTPDGREAKRGIVLSPGRQ
jgi:hypothetical protein